MSQNEQTISARRRHGPCGQGEARKPLAHADIQKELRRIAAELTNPPVKVADSSMQMWQKYSDSRLRDFSHSQ
jgi:hypothetical protein